MVRLFISVIAFLSAISAYCCTSMIVSGQASADGRPLLWKHRDTSASNNFLYRVEGNPETGKIGYVGLFNGGDSLILEEVWMGMNDAGFAIMNTVAYNLAENSPEWRDREGFVMAEALSTCRSVDDFEMLLSKLPKPMGVQTNFGVLDSYGNGAYFETDDYKYTRYDLKDEPRGVLVRTNFAMSGEEGTGRGYERYEDVETLLAHDIETGSITPALLTETMSRSFYSSRLDCDAELFGDQWLEDQDYVPRKSSTATIVVEGILPGESPKEQVMWANVGYPPCSHVSAADLEFIPAELGPTSQEGFYSPQGLASQEKAKTIFTKPDANGRRFMRMDVLRSINEEERAISLENYAKKRAKQISK